MTCTNKDCDHEGSAGQEQTSGLSRREVLQAAGTAVMALNVPRGLLAEAWKAVPEVAGDRRFPHFRSQPVPYFNVKMQDVFWAPRQKVIREVTVAWATAHWDKASGLAAYKANPQGYQSRIRPNDMEAIKFIESMATVIGLERDPAIEGLVESWAAVLIASQGSDGYLGANSPVSLSRPSQAWQAFPGSHETYLLGHYLEAAITYRESTGSTALYDSAIRAVDNMVAALLDSRRPYISGHPEVEQALMRLYAVTGDTRYTRLCAWLIAQRGHHENRASLGRMNQDHLPVAQQRTIEGHAVMAGYLFNGVTQYVGATGDTAYREAVLAVWDDLVQHKMYLHGASGNISSNWEGYKKEPYVIPPEDTYGESCAAWADFQWAHSLFQLTGAARYLDIAEIILYNTLYASLALAGDRFFYRNVSQADQPSLRYAWHLVPCCVPNIVKAFCKVGGFFYSIDADGIFVNQYGASQANIPFRGGVGIIQRGDYPWSGNLSLQLEPKKSGEFTLRLRKPAWAKSCTVGVNGKAMETEVQNGWVVIRRYWKPGDQVDLQLPMTVEWVTMGPQFKDYEGAAALKRGPIVYCLEQPDSPEPVAFLYLPENAQFTAEHRRDLLGGVTVLRGSLPHYSILDGGAAPVPVQFIPYGVWNNREPEVMRIWLASRKLTVDELMNPLAQSQTAI